jgi:3-dehydroquinate dehydratase/shikimate dehydrogenase
MYTMRLAGTLSVAPSPWGDDLREVPTQVDLLEVRGDRIGHIDPDWLRSRFHGQLLLTLRSTAEGGSFDAAPEQRHRRLCQAARHYDLVDLEADRDLVPEVLTQIPAEQRLISWTGPASDSESMKRRLRQLTSVPARLYKAVPAARTTKDGLAPLQALRQIDRPDVIAFASGAAGFWSRLIAPHLGAPIVFGGLGANVRSLREPPVTQLIQDYGVPTSPRPEALYAIVGHPVTASLSPLLHNAAYRALGMPALFVPFEEEQFAAFWRDVVESHALDGLGLPLRGLTVVSPHKDLVLQTDTRTSAKVQLAGSANIVVRNGHGWHADSTDPEGVVEALRERGIPIARQTAAVIGCGGAGRAAAAALALLGAEVTLVNRSRVRGLRAQRQLGLPFVPLHSFSARGYSTVVNATPLGRDGESLPFDIAPMRDGGAVIDLTYGQQETPLIEQARDLGLTWVDGREVCLIQVRHQFRLMTGVDMPAAEDRRAGAAVYSAAI